MMAMIIVNQFRDAIESRRKRRLEDHFVENEHRKRAAITEIQSTLLESDKFDNASSNSSKSSTASLDPLPSNEFLQSDELKVSADMTCNDKEITETNNCLTTETNNYLTIVVEPKNVPSYILKAHSRFISHINKSGKLRGLKFIGIVSGFKTDSNPYLWHQTVNPNSTIHEENHLKEFSYSVLRLDKFQKTTDQLKNNQDRWISLILHISEMTEEEAKEIFDDEPVFQEVLQILKLDNLSSNKCQEYLHFEKIRRSEEESNRSEFQERWKIGEEIFDKIIDELTLDICQKIQLEIKRRRNRNEAIAIKEIVGPIVDEHFDDQNFIKIDTEKHRSIIMDILKRHQISIPYDYIDIRRKWLDEDIKEFKEATSKHIEDHWLAATSPKLAPENELAKEKLVQKTFIKSIEEYNSTVKPPR
jgi:hypothetical protein